jgi:hypothetical protein
MLVGVIADVIGYEVCGVLRCMLQLLDNCQQRAWFALELSHAAPFFTAVASVAAA